MVAQVISTEVLSKAPDLPVCLVDLDKREFSLGWLSRSQPDVPFVVRLPNTDRLAFRTGILLIASPISVWIP